MFLNLPPDLQLIVVSHARASWASLVLVNRATFHLVRHMTERGHITCKHILMLDAI